jgi:hypothetical protein
MKPPLEISNWYGGQTGVDSGNSGATCQGTRDPYFSARVALRKPPKLEGSVAKGARVFQAPYGFLALRGGLPTLRFRGFTERLGSDQTPERGQTPFGV